MEKATTAIRAQKMNFLEVSLDLIHFFALERGVDGGDAPGRWDGNEEDWKDIILLDSLNLMASISDSVLDTKPFVFVGCF